LDEENYKTGTKVADKREAQKKILNFFINTRLKIGGGLEKS
jgi:hypothetical protein